MRILFLAPRFPLPTVKGDKLRAWQFLRLLSSVHEVTLLSYIHSAEELALRAEVEKVCEVVTVPFGPVARGLGLVGAAFSRVPLQALLFGSGPMKRRVAELLHGCDVVHCNTLRMASNLPEPCPVPLVVDFVDALSATYRRRAESSGFAKGLAFGFEAKRLAAYEERLQRQAAFACAVSAEDAEALGGGVVAVPHGIDTEEFCPPEPGAERAGIVFTGNMQYPPNVEAAVFFAREVFPKVRSRVRDARLRLVGVNPSAEVRALAGDGIEVAGYKPSVAEELRRSAVAVAPVRSGGGVKTKILEALGCGTPVVAMAAANAGINARDGEEIVLAENAEDMAEAVVSLLEERERAEALGMAGRALVERAFSWEVTGRRLLEAYETLGGAG